MNFSTASFSTHITLRPKRGVYLVDTDVISELHKKDKANRRVTAFFKDASVRDLPLYLATVTIGELRRGVERREAA